MRMVSGVGKSNRAGKGFRLNPYCLAGAAVLLAFGAMLVSTEAEGISHASLYFILLALAAGFLQILLAVRAGLRRERAPWQLLLINGFLGVLCLIIFLAGLRERDDIPDAPVRKLLVWGIWGVSSLFSVIVAVTEAALTSLVMKKAMKKRTKRERPEEPGNGKAEALPAAAGSEECGAGTSGNRIKRWLRENGLVLIFLAAAVIWMIPGMSNALRGDAGLNFRFYHDDRNIFSLTSFRTMDAYSHLGYAYSIGVLALQGLTGDTQAAMHFWNVLLFLTGGLAFYLILEHFYPDRPGWLRALTAGVFIFSPYTMGMCDDTTWDYWTILLFVILILCYVKKWTALELAVGAVFCFTKEPCVVVYAVFVLCDFLQVSRKGGLGNAIRQGKYWISLLIGILWLFLYERYAHWAYAGGNAFQLDPGYIGERLKTVLVLNFGWVVTGMMIACVILLAVRRKRGREAAAFGREKVKKFQTGENGGDGHATAILHVMLPAGVSWIAFLVFSCTFVTVNNPRYIDSGLVFPYLMAAMLILELAGDGEQTGSNSEDGADAETCCRMGKRWGEDPKGSNHRRMKGWSKMISSFLGVAMSLLMLLSVFRTIDPVSRAVFPQMKTGNGIQLMVGSSWNEGANYNGQHLYQEDVFNQALEGTFAGNPDSQIVFPLLNQNPWYFDGLGQWEPCPEGVCRVTEYWNPEISKRNVYPGQNTQEFAILEVQDFPTLQENLTGGTAVYFYVDIAGADLAEEIRKNCTVEDESSYTVQNWTMHCIEFRQ